MAAFESSYKSLLQGVSQQIPSARQDGQLSQQINMLSDTTTDLRRRTGTPVIFDAASTSFAPLKQLAFPAEVDGEQFHIVISYEDLSPSVRVINLAGTQVASFNTGYVSAIDPNSLQYVGVDDALYIANTEKTPNKGSPGTSLINPAKAGFFRVVAGVFNQRYDLTITNNGTPVAVAYDTPDGTTAGDAALATPAHICTELAALVVIPGVTVSAYGDSIFFLTTGTALSVSSPTGQQLVTVSGNSTIRDEAQLPPTLSANADGYTLRVGSGTSYRYYRWKFAETTWLESPAWGQDAVLGNVPIRVSRTAGVWALDNNMEGRLAGDTETNPDPEFMTRGVTGLGVYQGRLVILAGSRVCMSASNRPARFYRSTVLDLLDGDTISIGASAASGAKWVQALQFDKDLLVFSAKYQAVVPGANAAITPRTASIVVLSTYDADVTTRPVGIGRTLMYPTVRSKQFTGVSEMAPTGNTDNRYTSYDVTAHIPTYIRGRVRFAVSATGSNMVLFGTTGNQNEIIVNEYLWNGDSKDQQAWHQWVLPYPVISAYFTANVVVLVMQRNGRLFFMSVDPRAPLKDGDVVVAPLDVSRTQTVSAGSITPSAGYITFMGSTISSITGCLASGPRAGDKVVLTWDGTKWTVPAEVEDGDAVTYGLKFTSTVEPTPPMKRDSNGVKVSSNKCTVLRFMVGTNNSRQFIVQVTDGNTSDPYPQEVSPLYWYSDELQLGVAQVAGADSVVIVPCRTVADSTRLILTTDSTGDLNIVSLEYVLRYVEKIQRQRF